MWLARSSAAPSGWPCRPRPTRALSCPISTGSPTCCGPWPAGRKASPSRVAPRSSSMPIAFRAAADVPANAKYLGVPVFANGVVPKGATVELDKRFLASSGFGGNVGEAARLLADDGSTIVAVGVGKGPGDAVKADDIRRAAAAFAKAAWHAKRAAFVLPAGSGLDSAAATRAVVEGIGLATYRFNRYKSSPKETSLQTVTVVGADRDALRRAQAVVAAVTLARDLVNDPAGALTPIKLAEVATQVAEPNGIEVTVMDEVEIENEGLGGLRGVSLGSDEPPRLIQLSWSPPSDDDGDSPTPSPPTVVIVGKGITFDSGGLSLKTGDGMMTMKTDMSG